MWCYIYGVDWYRCKGLIASLCWYTFLYIATIFSGCVNVSKLVSWCDGSLMFTGLPMGYDMIRLFTPWITWHTNITVALGSKFYYYIIFIIVPMLLVRSISVFHQIDHITNFRLYGHLHVYDGNRTDWLSYVQPFSIVQSCDSIVFDQSILSLSASNGANLDIYMQYPYVFCGLYLTASQRDRNISLYWHLQAYC